MQCAVIEFAREVLQPEAPTRPSSTSSRRNPVIDLMPDQHEVADKGGTMRLGLYPARLMPGSKATRGLWDGDRL